MTTGRFQRLEDSEDIGTNQTPNFSSDYYDEPQNVYSSPQPHAGFQTQEPAHIYSTDDHRRMSYTTRKPVAQGSYPPLGSAPEEPLINPFVDPSPPLRGSMDSRDPRRLSVPNYISKTASSIWSRARGNAVSHISTPLWAAPWRHEPSPDFGPTRTSTVRRFDRKKQQNRIFFHFFFQWLIPVVFCVAIAGTFRFYSSKSQIRKDEKYWFNALNTGFSLCLGFAVVNGMKEYANILRWSLLSHHHVTLQQFEILLNVASQKAATRFLWVGRTAGSILPNRNQVLCFTYLFLILGLQIAIALLGLCQSVETNVRLHYLTPGDAAIADLSFITLNYDGIESAEGVESYRLQSSAVNGYGIAGQAFVVNVSGDPNPDAPMDAYDGIQIYTDNSTKWWYRFSDSCVGASCTTTYTTNRWVSSIATCKEYHVVSGGYTDDSDVQYIDDTGHRSNITYKGLEYSAATTYYAHNDETCGPRCTTVYALNVGWVANDDEPTWEPQFFICNNTVSQVHNTDKLLHSDEYAIPDQQARLIAGAIGYNGGLESGIQETLQTNTYLGLSEFSWLRLNGERLVASDMGNWIMHFSMSAVAALDDLGPQKSVYGQTPNSAQYLQVKWPFVIIILIAVPGIQFLVLIGTVIWGNKAVVRDGSFLSTAVLMRPIADRLERSGCALTSDEICDVLGNPRLAYGVKMPGGSYAYEGMSKGNGEVMHLDVVPEDERVKPSEVGWRVGAPMPQGHYDGVAVDEVAGSTSGRSTGATALRLRKRRQSF